ncbi:MAG TPA: exopolysaccharide transport family protein, partial [Blastocatellia bacterium]|nr:exopolysaccharide transport family protein [Blastocatellia bacterium]
MAEERLELEKPPQTEEAAIERSHYPAARASYGYGYGYAAQDEEMHLRDMWRIVRKRKWLVISVTVIVTTVVAIQMVRTRSIYQAYALVEVEKSAPTATKSGEMILQDNDLDSLKTKILAVKTQPVLQDVVKSLGLDRDPRFIQKEATRPLMATIKGIMGHPTAPASDDSTDADAGSNPATDDQSEPDPKMLEGYSRALDEALSVDLIRDTRAIKISYEHFNPEEAAAIANQVAKSFITLSFQNQTSQFTHTSEWLDTSTRQLKARVEQAEQSLADYTKSHNMFSTDGKQTLTTDKLTHLHDQLNRAQTDVIMKQSMYDAVKSGHTSQLPEAYGDSRLGQLRTKLEDLQTQAGELSVRYGPKNPNLMQVNREIAITQEQLNTGTQALLDKLKGEYARAVSDEKALETALAAAKSEAVQENQDDIQFSILKQDVDTAKALYTDFLQKTNQANLQVAEQAPNMHVIQPALVPSVPVAPKRKGNTLIAFFLSLAGGIGLTFFLEYLDTTIKSVEDIARFVQLPTLGVIPAIASAGANVRELKSGSHNRPTLNGRGGALMRPGENGLRSVIVSGQVVAHETHSSAAEAYRALRTSVLLSSAGHPPKTLLITSGQPGEGKTTTVVNTAMSLA